MPIAERGYMQPVVCRAERGPYACTRDAGHESPHRAGPGGVEWEDRAPFWQSVNRRRLALWAIVTVCLILGGAAAEALAFVWAMLIVALLLGGTGLVVRWWLSGEGW